MLSVLKILAITSLIVMVCLITIYVFCMGLLINIIKDKEKKEKDNK